MIRVLIGQGQYSFRKRVGTVDYPYTNRKKGCACTKSHPYSAMPGQSKCLYRPMASIPLIRRYIPR